MSDERSETIEKAINKEVASGIATVGGSQGALGIVPRNMGEMMEFAKMMAISGPCVRPAFRGNPGACLAIAMQAFKWGADPFAVANKAYVTKGRGGEEQIAYEAQLVHAIVNSNAPLQYRLRVTYSGEGPQRRCKVIGFLKDEDEPFEFETPMIKDIGVKNSPLWQADPDQQLHYYGTRGWARRHVPEVLLGIYTREEIEAGLDLSPVERSDRAVYPDGEQSRPKRPEPEPVQETVVETYEVVDHTGVVISFAGVEAAMTAWREAMDQGRKERGADGLNAVWENSVGLMDELDSHGRNDLTQQMGAYYAELRDGAGRTTKDVEDEKREAEEDKKEAAAAAPAETVQEKQPEQPSLLPPIERPTIFQETTWGIERTTMADGKTNWSVTRDQFCALIGHCQNDDEVSKLVADNAALLKTFRAEAPAPYVAIEKAKDQRRRQFPKA